MRQGTKKSTSKHQPQISQGQLYLLAMSNYANHQSHDIFKILKQCKGKGKKAPKKILKKQLNALCALSVKFSGAAQREARQFDSTVFARAHGIDVNRFSDDNDMSIEMIERTVKPLPDSDDNLGKALVETNKNLIETIHNKALDIDKKTADKLTKTNPQFLQRLCAKIKKDPLQALAVLAVSVGLVAATIVSHGTLLPFVAGIAVQQASKSSLASDCVSFVGQKFFQSGLDKLKKIGETPEKQSYYHRAKQKLRDGVIGVVETIFPKPKPSLENEQEMTTIAQKK